jgi:hypothetical protein
VSGKTPSTVIRRHYDCQPEIALLVLRVEGVTGDWRQRRLIAGETQLHAHHTVGRYRQISEVLGCHEFGVLALKIGL